jgi:SAM-dependent methyltransferase
MTGAEIGCGQGVLRHQLSDITAWTVDGIDLDINSLKHNEQDRGEIYLYNVLEKNDSFKNRYDFIFLYDVLEHIDAPHPFLEACLFHLKKQGHLFVNVPALESQKSAYDRAIGHIRRYNKKTLSDELSKAGLKILDLNYWGFSLLPLLFLRKITSSNNQSDGDIIKKGFKPPHNMINSFLKILMRVETALLKKAPLGISLMAAAVKE